MKCTTTMANDTPRTVTAQGVYKARAYCTSDLLSPVVCFGCAKISAGQCRRSITGSLVRGAPDWILFVVVSTVKGGLSSVGTQALKPRVEMPRVL